MKTRQEKVLDAARRHVGSTDWNQFVVRDNVVRYEKKCNLFVAEMLEAGGVPVPKFNKGGKLLAIHNVANPFNQLPEKRYPTADQWYRQADLSDKDAHKIPGMTLVGEREDGLDKSMAGDIITDGKHVAIITDAKSTISAASYDWGTELFNPGRIVKNDWGFRRDKDGNVQNVRVYRYTSYAPVITPAITTPLVDTPIIKTINDTVDKMFSSKAISRERLTSPMNNYIQVRNSLTSASPMDKYVMRVRNSLTSASSMGNFLQVHNILTPPFSLCGDGHSTSGSVGLARDSALRWDPNPALKWDANPVLKWVPEHTGIFGCGINTYGHVTDKNHWDVGCSMPISRSSDTSVFVEYGRGGGGGRGNNISVGFSMPVKF